MTTIAPFSLIFNRDLKEEPEMYDGGNNTENFQKTFNIINPDFLFVIKCIYCLIGITINVSILAAAVIHHRQSRCKPRTVFLLAIVFSYILFFIPDSIEMLYGGSYPIESICQIHLSVTGVSQALLLLNMFLALSDRYVAINYPVCYQEKMTVSLACGIILLGSIIIVFFLKIDYIVRLDTFRCEMWLVHANTISTILILLFLSCLVLNFIVYQQTKIPLCETISSSDSFNEDYIVDVPPFETQSRNEIEDSINNNDTSLAFNVTSRLLSSTEMEATRTLIFDVTCLVSYQTVIFVSAFLACRIIFGELECDNFKWIGPGVKELTLIPAIYGPLIFLVRNKELRDYFYQRIRLRQS